MSPDPASQHALLASVESLAGLDGATLAALASELDEQALPDGAVLMRQGEPADAMYLLKQGEVEVAVATGGRSVIVERLQAGAVIGEMALLAGNRRSATVTARGPVTVARFTRAAFDRLASANVGLREHVAAAMMPRLERVELAALLEAWFGAGPDDVTRVRELQGRTEWLALPAGATLYRPGDAADGMYLVASGRLGVSPHAEVDLRGYQVGRGESVGELGVLGEALRTEEVTAVRDTHLLRVPQAVVEEHPAVVARMARAVALRLRGPHAPEAHGNGLRTLALLPTRVGAPAPAGTPTPAGAPAHPAAPTRALAAMLDRHLGGAARTRVLDEASVTEVFGGALPEAGSILDSALTHWLNELEADHDYLILVADESSSGAWADRCRRQADAVLLVADGGAAPDALTRTAPAGAQLVLLHPAGTASPSGTAAWLDATGASEWHHVRAGDGYGLARMARRLTGHAVGLVFSGGGARGYAHIGLLRAIEERGLEVDMVAGTSMGALIAASYAFARASAAVEQAAVDFGDRKRLLDRTLPVVALTKSGGVTRTFMTFFGEALIEDLWTPFVCVSANLFEAVPVEHTRGRIWEAVRASSAIPGVFSPMVKDGALLVDGAVMNAFPVELMRAMVGRGTVIASSVMAKSPPRAPYDFGPSVSGWHALAQYLKPRRLRTRYPTMIKILMEATSVGSKHQSLSARADSDLLVEFPVQGFSKLEFHRHAELIDLGYRHAAGVLEEWLATAGAEVASRNRRDDLPA